MVALSEELAGCLNTFSDDRQSLHGELREIADFITKARDEIRALRPNNLRLEDIPSAGAELDAIVKDTEGATNVIMTAAEAMLAGDDLDLAGYRDFVSNQVMAIFEACSFQDITGQRVTKVVHVLRELEQRIGSLATNLGVDDAEEEETDFQRRRREQLLNGPAIDGPSTSQDDIDAMFA
jgi:chemotaxis protein CheZ